MKRKILLVALLTTASVFLGFGNSGAYYSDTVTSAGNTFTAGTWEVPEAPLANILINEVYYNTDGRQYNNSGQTKTELEGKNEWIELYNPNNVEVNIKNWTITDNYMVKTINPNVSIPAHGFALLSHDNDTWHFWGDPSGSNIVTINLTGDTNWLSNSDDRVILKDATSNIIDQMSYGTDTSVFNPPCQLVTAGKSLSRILGNPDTNMAIDFIQTAPTPGS